MVNWIEEYNKNQKKSRETILNEEYIDWLKKFVSRKYRFCDTDSQYYSAKTDISDRKNIDLLQSLFNGIDHFASENDIYPYSCQSGIYYNVVCDNFYFKIGMIVGQETCYFCEKNSYDENASYIDYIEMVENYRPNEKKNKKKKARILNS